MPVLLPTSYAGVITYLGRVLNKPAVLASHPVAEMFAGLDGVEGEVHGGATRPSCSRVLGLYPRATVIRNTRQFSVLSAEELAEISGRMGLESLDPSVLGASLVIEGIPDFTHVPPSSRLQADGASAADRGPHRHLRSSDRGSRGDAVRRPAHAMARWRRDERSCPFRFARQWQ